MRDVPLFPLNVVLFPGGWLPLRIFEDRYRQMLRACLDGDRRVGIVLIKSGTEVGGPAEPCQVGTLGRIDEIGEPQHGAIPLTVAGEARFRIAGLDRSLPYLVGHVEELDGSPDPEAQVASETLARVANRYVRLLMASHGQFRGPVHLTGDPGEIERLAGQLLFNHANEVRQAILEAEPLSSRLRMMRRTLSRSVEAAEAALMRGGPGREPTVFGIN